MERSIETSCERSASPEAAKCPRQRKAELREGYVRFYGAQSRIFPPFPLQFYAERSKCDMARARHRNAQPKIGHFGKNTLDCEADMTSPQVLIPILGGLVFATIPFLDDCIALPGEDQETVKRYTSRLIDDMLTYTIAVCNDRLLELLNEEPQLSQWGDLIASNTINSITAEFMEFSITFAFGRAPGAMIFQSVRPNYLC